MEAVSDWDDSGVTGREFVTLVLADEEYAVDIYRVQEIIGYSGVTKIPRAPPFILGVMNLRGAVVPVVDLRIKFQVGVPNYDRFTVVVVVEVAGRVMGIVVDGVSDVVSLAEHEIRETPTFAAKIDTSYIAGLAQKEDKFIILLDIDRVLSENELAQVDSV
jgi:purine-binding chemotaxis protein CheW